MNLDIGIFIVFYSSMLLLIGMFLRIIYTYDNKNYKGGNKMACKSKGGSKKSKSKSKKGM
jgi:hypothetical protein